MWLQALELFALAYGCSVVGGWLYELVMGR